MKNKITLFPLLLLIVSAIDNIRTLPTTAFFGSSLVLFYLLSVLIFLIPVALISAQVGAICQAFFNISTTKGSLTCKRLCCTTL